VNELSAGHLNEIRAGRADLDYTLCNRQRLLIVPGMIRYLENALSPQPVRHRENEQRSGLILNKLPQEQKLADILRTWRRGNAICVFQSLNSCYVVGCGAHPADARHDYHHIFRWNTFHQMFKSPELGSLKMRRDYLPSLHFYNNPGMSFDAAEWKL
jgi:hypothetical protein